MSDKKAIDPNAGVKGKPPTAFDLVPKDRPVTPDDTPGALILSNALNIPITKGGVLVGGGSTGSSAAGAARHQSPTHTGGQHIIDPNFGIDQIYAYADDTQTTGTWARFLAYGARLAKLHRLLAYTSEVGEAFRPVAHPYLTTSAYAVSWAYVLGDVAYDTYTANNRYNIQGNDLYQHCTKRFVFQGLASMLLPSICVHTIVHETKKRIFTKYWKKQTRFSSWGPSICGLAFIPALPFLMDEPVEYLVDYSMDFLWPVKMKVVHNPHVLREDLPDPAAAAGHGEEGDADGGPVVIPPRANDIPEPEGKNVMFRAGIQEIAPKEGKK